jgi:predicted acetyltransferase
MQKIMQNENFTIRPASLNEKFILQNLMELYQHDFSEFDHSDVNQAGLYEYAYLDSYWSEPHRYPFLVRVEDKLAGFVLVNLHADPVHQEPCWSVAEFFIMRKYRRLCLGSKVAERIFDMFRGKWQVAQIEANLPARAFWHKTIGDYTHGAYEEVSVLYDQSKVILQRFDNSLPEEA